MHAGPLTFVGRAALLMAVTREPGHFQRLMQRIGYVLMGTTLVIVVVLFIAGTVALHRPLVHQLRDCLVLTIASIPVALPTVLSVTMAVGAQHMAARHVIVKRLPAVEELAAMDVLCSDKTGTLTKNQLTVDRPHLCEGRSEEELLRYAFLATEAATSDAIDLCLRGEATRKVPDLQGDLQAQPTPGYHLLLHEPFNSTSKMAFSHVRRLSDGRTLVVLKGAPQVVFDRADMAPEERRRAEAATEDMAKRGLRALAVAVSDPYEGRRRSLDEVRFHCLGCFPLLDPPREDSAATIRLLRELGIQVKMITGDSILIAREVAKRLGMAPMILSPAMIQQAQTSSSLAPHLLRLAALADGFAQTTPQDKYTIVDLLQRGSHRVGMTGDGVNGQPGLRRTHFRLYPAAHVHPLLLSCARPCPV